MFHQLEKTLKAIRKNKDISNYRRWIEVKSSINKFYTQNRFGCDVLYDRLIELKRKSETFKLLGVPIYITIVFGIWVTLGMKVIDALLNIRQEFLTTSKNILDKALAALTPDDIEKATAVYNATVNETLAKYTGCFVVIIILIIICAFLLAYLIYPVNRLKNTKIVIYGYEIEIIESKIKELEDKIHKKCRRRNRIRKSNSHR